MEAATITRKPNASRLNVSKRKVRREKTFTGCWTCRSRKVKCDEGKPECATCKKRGQKCTGYEPKYIWVTGYQNYPPGERRVLRSELTWYGHTIYPPTEVDQLIAQCNIEDHSEAGSLQKAAGPFTVLKFCAFPKIPPSLPELPDCSSDDDRIVEELRHHYFTHTALNMMPFKHEKNPWLYSYPRIAEQGSIRGQKSLYYAILAQAAGNLAQLGSRSQKMSKLATKFYTDGVKHLRINLKSMDFSTMLASIGTLIMAEVYAGLPNAWRMHLNGAWTFLMTRKNEKPWEHSEEAWLMAQSLCLVKIRADTMQQPQLQDTKHDETVKSVISSIAHRYEFGFTAGAGQSLMKCIQDITSLESRLKFQETGSAEEIRNAIEELHQRIKHCKLEYLTANELMSLHHEIFRTGVQIHFHRRILNCIPSALVSDLDYMLKSMERYQTLEEGGYISLWPVFIGAVEAVEERHKRQVRAWMDNVETMGAANRKDVRSTIEAVWKKRAQQTKILGHDREEGEIIVDWREVMREMNAEILLV